MASQVVLDNFQGSGVLTGTSPGVLTGVGGATWATFNQAFSGNTSYTRGALNTSVLVPAVGQGNFARLSFSDVNHTAGVTVFEASIRPEMQMRVWLDFEDRYASLEVGAAGAGAWFMDNAGAVNSGSFTAAAPGAMVVLRMEFSSTQARFYVEDALVGSFTTSIPYGINVISISFGIPRAGAPHGLAVGSTVAALTYLHMKTQATSGPLGGPVSSDTEGPVFGPSSITVNALYDQYTASWASAADNATPSGAIIYEYRIDGGAWIGAGTARTFTRTGRAPGSAELVEVRAKDAAGNYSAIISAVASLYPTPTEVGLFTDAFTKDGALRGSSGQTGLWSRSPWYAYSQEFGSGAPAPGSGSPGEQRTNRSEVTRTDSGLRWFGADDLTMIQGYVPPNGAPVPVEFPVVMEVAGWGDFVATAWSAAVAGGISLSAALVAMADGSARLVCPGMSAGGAWLSGGAGEGAYRPIPALTNDQFNTVRVELTLTSRSIFLNGVLMGTAAYSHSPVSGPKLSGWMLWAYTGTSGYLVAARGLTQIGTRPMKFRYFNLRSGRLESGPLGAPHDPNDDPPIDPGELAPAGPGNEPAGDDFSSFWTAFNFTYEVP